MKMKEGGKSTERKGKERWEERKKGNMRGGRGREMVGRIRKEMQWKERG